MCGIIGYKGPKNAVDIVLKGLQALEYRGYDSFGIASLNQEISIFKETGKIGKVKLADLNLSESNVAIGHTRWATHGNVTKENAHPHFSADNNLAIVQNGIVENFQELKKQLKSKGHLFFTQTDTEVIMRLIEEELKDKEIVQAVQTAFKKLEGRNAIVVLDKNSNKIIGVRNGSPLILALGENEMFLASDPSAILEHTKDIIFLEDNEMIVMNSHYEIFNIESGKKLEKEIETITWDIEQAKKGDYPHFMIKEIMEQKFTISQAIAQDKENVMKIAYMINNAFGTYAVGCGTAGKVCLSATYSFSDIAKKHINFTFGSEFPSYHNFIKEKSLLIAVSQSGETADTLEAIKVAQDVGAKVISIVNVMGSTIMRKSDAYVLVNAGPEKAVCSTKATTGQLAISILLAYASANKFEEGINILKNACNEIDKMLNRDFLNITKELASKIKDWESMYVIGRGKNYPIALESAIKIQEVSYIHAEGFAGGELKHGPIALIGKGTPCIALVANDEVKEEILSNAMEIKARGGYIIGISPENNDIFDFHIKVPDVGDASPIVNLIPIQLLSYYLAIAKGLDPDMPRNLAKSVTVK